MWMDLYSISKATVLRQKKLTTTKNTYSNLIVWQVHLLNDDARGATVEAVISRMKTVQSTMTRNSTSGNKDCLERASMRLIAISATIPNVEDVS